MSSLFAQTRGVGLRGSRPGLFISAVVVMTIVVALFIAIRPVPASVQITFVGFTNDPPIPHVTYASFCVSNTGKCYLYGPGAYDFERKGWPRNPFQIESPPAIGELKPGEFKLISFRELPQSGPWRLELPLAKIDWRFRLQQKWPRFLRKLPWRLQGWLVPRHQDFYSDWITTPSNPTPVR